MKTGTALLLGAAGLVIGGELYVKAINKLQFNIASVGTPDSSGNVPVTIAVTNPSFVGYPIPAMVLNVTDATGMLVGVIVDQGVQYVAGNSITNITGYISPSYGNLVSELASAVAKAISTGSAENILPTLTISGNIQVGPFAIPINQQINLSAANL